MKRRKINSDSPIKRSKHSSDNTGECSTPTRPLTTRQRFVTPFKTPVKKQYYEQTPKIEDSKFTTNVISERHTSEPTSPKLSALSPQCLKLEISNSKRKKFITPLKGSRNSNVAESPMQKFLREKKQLKEIEEKESLLRKFKQYQRAKDNGEIEKLEDLVKQWRSVSQEVLYKLLEHGKSQESNLNLASVLKTFRVDPKLVKYDHENDEFIQ